MNVLIISSSEGITLSLLRCLKLLGIKSHVISIWDSSKSCRLSRFCINYVSYTVSDLSQQVERIVSTINDYCRQKQIEVILPTGLFGTFFVAKIKDQLISAKVFPVTDAEQIAHLHNKWLFYQFLLQQNIPVPKTTLIDKVEQINSLKFNFPIILKPLALGGGKGVKKFDLLADVDEYLSMNNAASKLPLLAQEYIPGFDIIFSIIAKNGEIIAWTIHKRTPYFLDFFKNDSILNIGKKIVSHYNYNGIANFDIRFDKRSNSVKVIECNPRFWASIGASVYYGVDFVKLGILLAQNNTLPDNLKKGVTSTEKIPYPWSDQFLRGLILGKYPFQSMNKISEDLAWQNLLDPLPNLYQKVWERLGIVHVHDGVMLEKL
ncbi:MAG: ATP-grasp domain-containing protein [Rhizonema sp. PD38]|nr:ATP-grasp domain-containing protein [Rhizonema sp. PD38]